MDTIRPGLGGNTGETEYVRTRSSEGRGLKRCTQAKTGDGGPGAHSRQFSQVRGFVITERAWLETFSTETKMMMMGKLKRTIL